VELNKVVSPAVLLLTLPLLGCGKILGIEEKHLLASDGTPSCSLVSDAGPAVRIINAIPDASALDLCHKPSNRASYGKPWFATHSSQCGEGVAYTQFTRNLAIDAGTYDFKLVAAGTNCDATGIEAAAVKITAQSSITLMAYGPDMPTARVATFPNRTEATDAQPVRFVNALNNAGQLTAGALKSNRTVMGTILFPNVEFGKVAPEGPGLSSLSIDDVDKMGYVTMGGASLSSLELDLGIQQATDTNIILKLRFPALQGHVYTAFALGTYGQNLPRPKIWSCDETVYEGPFLKCGNPVSVAVEAFDVNLADAFTVYVEERKNPAIEAILAENTDLLCVTELFNPAVTARLRDDESIAFQHRVFSDEVPSARVSSLAQTETGQAPVYPPVACPDDLGDTLGSWLHCAMDNPACTQVDPTTNEHQFVAPGAGAAQCMFNCGTGTATALLGELLGGGRSEAGSCYWCALTHLAAYESFEHTLDVCRKVVSEPERSHMVYGGTTGIAVFSRDLELGEPELVLLPSSGWQRAAMRVPVTLPNDSVIDYWCTSIRFPNTENEMCYAGAYAPPGREGSAIEQGLQVARVVEAIGQKAAATGIPAIVAVTANAGPERTDAATGEVLVHPLVEEIYDLMATAWPELVASQYVPACTYCGEKSANALNDSGTENSYWATHLFGIGISPSAVESTARTFTTPTISMTDAKGNALKAPVSQEYGMRSVVRITQ
jgi:hypothetical protein